VKPLRARYPKKIAPAQGYASQEPGLFYLRPACEIHRRGQGHGHSVTPGLSLWALAYAKHPASAAKP